MPGGFFWGGGGGSEDSRYLDISEEDIKGLNIHVNTYIRSWFPLFGVQN